MTFETAVHTLLEEAERTNQRRLLVLAGDRSAGIDAAYSAIEIADLERGDVSLVTTRTGFRFHRIPPSRAGELLGTTRSMIVLDCHDGWSPTAIGQVAGAVDGGGLLVLLTPPLSSWPATRDSFDERLVVRPYRLSDVTGHLRTRLVETIETHPGVAIVEVASSRRRTVRRDGLTGESPSRRVDSTDHVGGRRFPCEVYDACVTGDQRRALRSFERLGDPKTAIVVEADRGRGKSTAAGFAAAAFAIEGNAVLVTAPNESNAKTLLDSADTVLERFGDRDDTRGSIRFERPIDAIDVAGEMDVVFVDEAAAIPVRQLQELLCGPSIGFCTTVRGYEGTGRGFEVRFRDRLRESDYETVDVHLDEPIRYAPNDPLETWLFRSLLLDASPPPASLVSDATPDSVEYREFDRSEVAENEHLLRSIFGLLVEAHYRTDPNDLARLLDAPNLSVHGLVHDGHVVSVALLAGEGGLDRDSCAAVYRGGRIRGNVLPELLMSQLREETAGELRCDRVVRIATHSAVRRSGFGSRLLCELRERSDADYFGTIFGATPELIRFWQQNGLLTIHLSATRNDTSGEYSILMVDPLSERAFEVIDRQEQWFTHRLPGILSDPLRDADPDVVRSAIATVETRIDPELSDREWTQVVSTAYGPGMYDVSPQGFRSLAMAALLDPELSLDAAAERLLVLKVLQGYDWRDVARIEGYRSPGHVMRTLAATYRPIVDRFGTERALDERTNYRDTEQ